MKITFLNNLISQICCWLDNEYELLTQLRWKSKHHRVKCHICGEILDSSTEKYSPEQCGWKRLKNEWCRPWICHSCLCHRDFKPYIKVIDKEIQEKENQERWQGKNINT